MRNILLRLLLVALPVFMAVPAHAQEKLETEILEITTGDGGKHDFQVELARTPEEQQQGLMFRTEMAPDAGMLFIFPGVRPDVSFWMKGTLIPLDMVFIRADGTVARVHSNAIPGDLTTIPAGEPVLAVLELNGGRADALGIGRGDKVFSPALSLAAHPLPVLEE